MQRKLKAEFGLKFNPFSTDVPTAALSSTARFEEFAWRIEHSLAPEGGFAMITGEPGMGKSVALRLLAEGLGQLREVEVGSLEHPQSGLADFYREMGDLFGVELRPHNRWAGFRVLREKWLSHIGTTLMRPVLLVDEAQEVNTAVLNELRILSSTRFDSRSLLGVVLAGDQRLVARLRHQDLAPLSSRIRMRLVLEHATPKELEACLLQLVEAAGNQALLTHGLATALSEHAMGNYRALTRMAGELLAVASRRGLGQLDEQLFLDVFAPPGSKPSQGKRSRARR